MLRLVRREQQQHETDHSYHSVYDDGRFRQWPQFVVVREIQCQPNQDSGDQPKISRGASLMHTRG